LYEAVICQGQFDRSAGANSHAAAATATAVIDYGMFTIEVNGVNKTDCLGTRATSLAAIRYR